MSNDDFKDKLIISRIHPMEIFEVTSICRDIDSTSISDILEPAKITYKESYDGIPLKKFLYVFVTKLLLIKKFREEVFESLDGTYDANFIKSQPIVFLRDVSYYDQLKYSYRLSNVPINPNLANTMKKQ